MNGMIAQIHSLPDLIRSVTRSYAAAVRAKAPNWLLNSSPACQPKR